jgi:hypothetical protein
LGSAFTALWLSLVLTGEILWWAKYTIMTTLFAWQTACMITRVLEDLKSRYPAWVEVFTLWISFVGTVTKGVCMPFGILIMAMAAAYNTVYPKPEAPANAPAAPHANAPNVPAAPLANAPAAPVAPAPDSWLNGLFQHCGVTLQIPAAVPARQNIRVNPPTVVRRPLAPVLPAAQPRHGPVDAFGNTPVDYGAVAATIGQGDPKPSTVNPDAAGGGPGSPPAANPSRKRAIEDGYTLQDGTVVPYEEMQALFEALKRQQVLLEKTGEDAAGQSGSP